MAKTVKITAGQPFTVFVPLVILNADGTKEAVDANTLTDVSVKAQNGAREYTVPANTYDHYLVLQVSKDLLPVGVYDLIITATLQGGREFRLAMQEAVGVMSWDWQTNWRDYLVGDHIELCDQPFIAGYAYTDAQYEEIKQQMLAKIAELELAIEAEKAAKERYEQAVLELDDIAKQGDNPNATNSAILQAVGGIDFSTLAKEQTLTDGVTAIRNDIAHINIDLTPVAKEQTLTAGVAEITNGIARLQGSDNTASVSAVQEAIVAIQQAHILNSSNLRGVVLRGNATPMSVLFSRDDIIRIDDNYIVGVPNGAGYLSSANVEYIRFAALNDFGNSPITGCPILKEVDLPVAYRLYGDVFFGNCYDLRKINMPYISTTGNNNSCFGGASKLIDIITGKGFASNMPNLLKGWSPSEALNTSPSLLTEEDIAAGFTTNLQKLLYNIREHIAANLSDRTGLTSYSITFSSAVKAAILADQATADAFTNKNWTIA